MGSCDACFWSARITSPLSEVFLALVALTASALSALSFMVISSLTRRIDRIEEFIFKKVE